MRDDGEIRCYVQHLATEHRRLHGILRRLQDSLVYAVGPDEAPTFIEVVRILGVLRDELTHHFAQEDAGGCLDEAVSHCPRLSAEARRIAAEHPELLADVDRLIAGVQGLEPTSVNQFALQREFAALFHKIRAHEKSEAELLQQGFGTTYDEQSNSRATLTQDF